ncbi:acetyltransferase [Sphingomonas baiyangensis]|nr:acetyltransferase [Sphingomonas baiyangensis]
MTRFAILGAGGHAKVVLEALRLAVADAEIVVVDDGRGDDGGDLLGAPIIGTRAALLDRRASALVPALGDNRARLVAIEWAREAGLEIASVIHPAAIVSPSAVIGAGCFLAAGAIVNADARLGSGVIVNTGASVDHDCVLGDGVHVAPGARLCGNVRIGARTLIGVGAAIIPGRTLGADCVVGAGAAVVRDSDDGVRIAGVPGRA